MAITLDGTAGITTPDLTDTSLTSGRVVYAGTSGNLTSSANLQFDGASLGVGVTPNAWSVLGSGMQLKGGGSVVGRTDTVTQTNYTLNGFFNGTDWKYIESTTATRYMQYVGAHSWYTAPAGTAGNTITFTQVLGVEAGKSLALEGATSQTGVGITFPPTQVASSSANTLDDYEEGTWTPSYSGGVTGVTYGSVRNGYYRKIGSQVTIWFGIMTDGLTITSSSLTLTGLPFTSSSSTGSQGTVNISNAVRWVSSPPIVGRVEVNQAYIDFYNAIGTTGSGVDPTLVTTGNMSTGSGNRNFVFATATYFV